MSPITLAVDMHGGDNGLPFMMKAITESLKIEELSHQLLLCGNEQEIYSEMTKMRLDSFIESGRISVIHAPQQFDSTQDETISRIWRKYPNSSLVKSISLQKEGKATVTLSAGDTGVLFTTATLLLGRQSDIERPALAATLPTPLKQPVLLLDVGANLDCKASHLRDFANLGSSYMEKVLGRKPKVSLLNVGSEPYKGPSPVRDAHSLLTNELESYCGYIEGNRVLTGDADVIVCDGFTGNALLKISEGMFRFIQTQLSDSLDSTVQEKMEIFNSELYGSVPMLGIKGNIYKAHGSSSINALIHAIITTVKTVYLLENS